MDKSQEQMQVRCWVLRLIIFQNRKSIIQDMNKYCLDTNFFVEAWNKYYSPDFCQDYWLIIDELGKQGIVFVTQLVKMKLKKLTMN